MVGGRIKFAERQLLGSIQLLLKGIAVKSVGTLLRNGLTDLIFICVNVGLVVSVQLLLQMVKSPGHGIG